MWKNAIKKGNYGQLNSDDETNFFAYILVEIGAITDVRGLLDFYEKPYQYQSAYDKINLDLDEMGMRGDLEAILENEELANKLLQYVR